LKNIFDIVERAKQELQATIDAIAEGVALYDADTLDIVRVNWPLARMYQTTPHQMVDTNLHSILCGCEESGCPLSDFLRFSRDVMQEYHREDPQQYWELTIYPLTVEQQEHPRNVVVIRDVTELHEAEEALSASETRYRSLFNGLPIGLYLTTPQGEILDCNPALVEMLGFPNREMLLKTQTSEGYIGFRDRLNFQTQLEKDGIVRGYENRWKRYDGSVFWVRETAHAVRDSEGKVVLYEGSVEDVTERKQVADALRKTTADLRFLSRRLEEVEENERQRLSQELHDQVGQNLTALNINFNVMRDLLSKGEMDQAVNWLVDCTDLVKETTVRIRDVMTDLRPPLLDEYGLVAALGWYARKFEQRTGIKTKVSDDEKPEGFPPPMALILFRIAQEALNNVAKHAKAQNVSIQLKNQDGNICLSITDDGCGINTHATKDQEYKAGWGINIMKERARAIGGKFRTLSGPGEGTRVVVEIERKKNDSGLNR
jgi:PAS domain S-box-containing protein